MSGDAVVSRELKSLQDELATAQRERSAAPAAPDTSATAPPPSPAVPEPAEDRELRDQLHALVEEVTSFLEEAEKGISAHPAQSVVGALLVGIFIGRLLGRR